MDHNAAQFCTIYKIDVLLTPETPLNSFDAINLRLSQNGTVLNTPIQPADSSTPIKVKTPAFHEVYNYQLAKIGNYTVPENVSHKKRQDILHRVTKDALADGSNLYVTLEFVKPMDSEELQQQSTIRRKAQSCKGPSSSMTTPQKLTPHLPNELRRSVRVRSTKKKPDPRRFFYKTHSESPAITPTRSRNPSGTFTRSSSTDDIPHGWHITEDWQGRKLYVNEQEQFTTLDRHAMKNLNRRLSSMRNLSTISKTTPKMPSLPTEPMTSMTLGPTSGLSRLFDSPYDTSSTLFRRYGRQFSSMRSKSTAESKRLTFEEASRTTETTNLSDEENEVLEEESLLIALGKEETESFEPESPAKSRFRITSVLNKNEIHGVIEEVEDIERVTTIPSHVRTDNVDPDTSQELFKEESSGLSLTVSKRRRAGPSVSLFRSKSVTDELLRLHQKEREATAASTTLELPTTKDHTPLIKVGDVHNFAFNLISKNSIPKLLALRGLSEYDQGRQDVDTILKQILYNIQRKPLKNKSKDKQAEPEPVEDPSKYGRGFFDKYVHYPDLCEFINSVKTKEQLPRCWSSKTNADNGRVYYLDHQSKQNTYLHPNIIHFDMASTRDRVISVSNPKLGENEPRRGSVQQSGLNGGAGQVDERISEENGDVEEYETEESSGVDAQDMLTDAEKYVMFFQQPMYRERILEYYPQYGESAWLRLQVDRIREDGLSAYNACVNGHRGFQFALFISALQDAIDAMDISALSGGAQPNPTDSSTPPTTEPEEQDTLTSRRTTKRKNIDKSKSHSDLEMKLLRFYSELKSKGYAQSRHKLVLTNVPRKNIARSVCRAIMTARNVILQRCKMQVTFDKEEGLDFSGPLREMFHLVSKDTFDPYRRYFQYASDNQYTICVASQVCSVDGELDSQTKQWFHFSGRLIALAILHRVLLDVYFVRSFYRALLRKPYHLEDLKSLDEDFYNSMKWLLDNDIDDFELDMHFEADTQILGQHITRPLKDDGEFILVTDRNKKEYVDLLLKWRTDLGTREAMNEICTGFCDVLPVDLVSKYFDAKELELVLCGIADLDIDDWKTYTEYREGYGPQSRTIQMFWEILEHDFNSDERLKLLQFVTGSTSLPFEGFKGLRGPNGKKRFCIQKWGKPERDLPRSHTCFNRLDLPNYTNKDTMRQKLSLAIHETEGFNLE